MSKPKLFHRYQRVELEIHDLAFEGKGISRLETEEGQFIVFVPNTIPGQKVLVKMVKVKRSFAEAKLLQVPQTSEKEVPVEYHPIPGAPYITLPIERQHSYKRQTTIELFARIGKIGNSEELLDAFIPSPSNFHYRNKMEYSFSAVVYDRDKDEEFNDFALGFKKRGQWLSVEPMKKDSGLFDKAFEDALPRIQNFFTERDHTAWHAKTHQGFCRFLTVKKSFKKDCLLINLVTTSTELDRFDKDAFLQLLKDILGQRLSGLFHTLNDDKGDRPSTSDGDRALLYGEADLIEEINGLDFKISLESFFQTNPCSAERLYSKALDYVFESDLGDRPVILDLFSGTGTITQLLAQRAIDKKVIGVEIVAEAVADAKRNAAMNGLNELSFYANDVGKFLLENPDYKGKIGTLVMDPPRAGISPKTLRKVMRLEAQRIVYISCNPATQARDMATLQESGYKLKKYSLVDQFPHTAHIESVALFEREDLEDAESE
ncbi:MAG: 23S rRNA (uracil(1939)-C(5))-methyltransferase RlmD [Verrucomicrobiota bacterium]